ncbi:MAG: response regulator transcription factor [Spirochaetia bacterium]|jgi:DNA-binding response OmpR family regulator
MMNELVAVVEDEDDIRALVTAALKKERFRVREHSDGRGLLVSLSTDRPDLLVLDVMLPDTDGFEICRRIRADKALSSIPIIILTARAEEADRILGLELGADDYVVKPFSPKELAARVKAVLRRAAPETARARIDAGDGLIIDTDTVEAFVGGQRLELTQAEFRILQLLASRTGWVFSREKILDYLWGNEKNVTDRSVDVHVKHLRDKLGDRGGRIVNVRGIGYKLVSSTGAANAEGR